MVIVELAFSPDSNAEQSERMQRRPGHRERLTALHADGEVLDAGPFADGSGSMVLFNTTRERVDEALADDPYYSAAGVTVLSIRELTPLFSSPSN